MSAGVLLNSQLTRRLGGQCRIDLATGTGLSLEGEYQAGFSCLGCHSPCEDITVDEIGVGTAITVTTVHGQATLRWSCPECGSGVSEGTTVLGAHLHAAEIELAPQCWRCAAGRQGPR